MFPHKFLRQVRDAGPQPLLPRRGRSVSIQHFARALLAAAVVVAQFGLVEPIARADVKVPIALQAQLISKLASFDRNMASRAGGTARILIIQKAGDSESGRTASQMATALGALADIGGIPKELEVVTFTSAGDLAALCRSKRASILYFSPGLDGDMPAIAAALNGVDILSVGAFGSQAKQGAVVAFELEEGKPRILVNLNQAKTQHVMLRSELLSLARIVGS